jgi:hypothetical protein
MLKGLGGLVVELAFISEGKFWDRRLKSLTFETYCFCLFKELNCSTTKQPHT